MAQGDISAALALGKMTELGLGAAKDPRRAFAYYRQAAEGGDAQGAASAAGLAKSMPDLQDASGSGAQYNAQAVGAQAAADAICTARKAIAEMEGLAVRHPEWPPSWRAEGLIDSLANGFRTSTLTLQAIRSEAGDVSSVNAPFKCALTLQVVSAKVTYSEEKPGVAGATRQERDDMARRNDAARESSQDRSAALVNRPPFVQIFTLYPIARNTYRVVTNKSRSEITLELGER